MKYLGLVFLALMAAFPFIVFSQNVKFDPTQPVAGRPVKFTYDAKGTKLEGKSDIICNAYIFKAGGPKSSAVELTKTEALYTAEIPTTDSATLVALVFSSGDIKDENAKGYYVQLSNQGKVPAEAYIDEAYLYDFFGQYSLGMKSDPAKAFSLYQKAFDLKPVLKQESMSLYLRLGYRLDPIAGRKRIEDYLMELSALKSLTEEQLITVSGLYMILKENGKSDSVNKAIVLHFPTGKVAFSTEFGSLLQQKDPKILEQDLDLLVGKYGLDLNKKSDQLKVANSYFSLATLYGREKNWEKFNTYAGKITDKVRLASLYNTIAWPLAEQNQETQLASSLSKKSLDLIDAAKADEFSVYLSRNQYLAGLQRNRVMYADTYALLLHNQGNNKEALRYQEIALDASDNPGLERYVMYLELSGNKEKAYSEADRIVKEGKATDALKKRFKTLYDAKKLAVPFESYIAGIEKTLIDKEKQEWIGKMTNEPAPPFSLVNRKGETVSLASLKGKVIVLDYWATWCGPCVASFPGMQKAVDKYAADPNVVFLFVNTWQREQGKRIKIVAYLSKI